MVNLEQPRVLHILALLAAACFGAGLTPPAKADAPPLDLLPQLANLKPSSADVTVAPSDDPANPGTVVTIQPSNAGYPGVSLPAPEGKPWDLSAYGHVEAKITNLGAKSVSVSIRVDNAGKWQDQPWNTESIGIKAGATSTVKLIFGYAYNKQKNYPLDPKAIVNFLFFTGKATDVEKFRIETFLAAGPPGEVPPINPDTIRIRPKNGVVLGAGTTLDAAKQLTAKNVTATLSTGDPQTLSIAFPPNQPEQSVSLKPAEGRWNLNDKLQVTFTLRNDGEVAILPRVKVNSNGGSTDWRSPDAPLAPGARTEIVVPFIEPTPLNLGDKSGGNKITSNTVSLVAIGAEKSDTARSLVVESIVAGNPPLDLPAWLGKKPPVDGDWVQTLNENFDGNELDMTVWNNTGPNFWDKQSHWSKDNLILGDGTIKMRYEKKSGPQNDDPAGKVTSYECGYLDSYGKWTQRYGYFEARMKIPAAPGLWPAMWLMPDRGVAFAPEQWKRANTGNGGMEFDIMENLTRYGTGRWNVAMHYDGYGKDHKAKGSDKIYAQPDKDGYITAGLLWTPGSAIFYANGKEVLRWEDARISNVQSNFLFTVPQGGWDNDPIDDAQLPADFIIDYVRVWQRKDLASPQDGKQAQPVEAVVPAPAAPAAP